MRTSRRWLAAIGAAALAAGVLAVATRPASGGLGGAPPWLPTLQVAKTIAKAQQQGKGTQVDVPPGTVFTIHVDCTGGGGMGSVDGSSSTSPYPVDLTYDATGAPLTAVPQDGWVVQNGVWTVSSWKLLHRQCTATETAVNGGPIPSSIEVQYMCDTTGTGLVAMTSSGDVERRRGRRALRLHRAGAAVRSVLPVTTVRDRDGCVGGVLEPLGPRGL